MSTQDRDAYALMGLPVHALGHSETIQWLWRAVRERQSVVLTTPNLNFVVACRTNEPFRQSVLESDIVVADGMPLVWIARLLGIPIRERVAGSSVFESIRTTPPPDNGPPMRVFFFGGQPGIAQLAHERVNAGSAGMVSVGYLDPGFGAVEQMSSDRVIETINKAKPDFLVVALGAAKGQAWIQRNRSRLSASVVSHLGAVVNFNAGSVKRAPLWVQKIGFEWLWRIKEEPALWRRYLKDSLALWSILMFEVLPLRLMLGLSNVSRMHFAKAQIKVSSNAASTKVKLVGAWGQPNISKLDAVLNAISSTATPVFVDLEDCSHLDSAVLGRVLILRGKRSAQGTTLELKNVSPSMQRVIRLHGVGYLLD